MGCRSSPTLAHHLRRAVFPLCVAANKADVAEPGAWDALAEKVEAEGGIRTHQCRQ